MTINQSRYDIRSRYIDGKLHKEQIIKDIPGYDESTYSRLCECGESTKMMFNYISTDPNKETPIFRLEKYETIPEGYSYAPVICSPKCSNNV